MHCFLLLCTLLNAMVATAWMSSSPNHLNKRSENLMTFCSESNGGGQCRTLTVDDKALKIGFDIDGGDLNKAMGFGPASAKVETQGMICGLAHQKRTDCAGSFLCGAPIGHCQGDRVIVTSEQFVDLPGKLFQNAQCMGCFKSPGA